MLLSLCTSLVLAQNSGSQALSVYYDAGDNLGKLRARFGIPAERSSRWHYQTQQTRTPTIILFPVGSGTTRYYLSQLTTNGRYKPTGFPWWVLSKETRIGARIRCEWSIDLRKAQVRKPGAVSAPEGTLRAFLYKYGLEPPEKVAKTVRASLAARKAFAAYQLIWVSGSFTYWFVWPDGTSSKWSTLTKDMGSTETYPKTPFSYPLTTEELRVLGVGSKSAQDLGIVFG